MQHFYLIWGMGVRFFYIFMEIVRILSNIKYRSYKGQFLNLNNQTHKIIIIKYIRQTTLMRKNYPFRQQSSESESSQNNYNQDSQHSVNKYIIAELKIEYGVNHYNQPPQHNEDSYQRYQEQDQPHSHISYQHSSDIQGQNLDMEDDPEDQGYSNFSWNSNSYSGYRGRNRTHLQHQEEQRRGISKEQINKIPTLKWTEQYEKYNKEEKCPICLNIFEVGQQLRVLFCIHRFHQKCIDPWLQNNLSCPTCRNPIPQITQK